MAPNPDQLTKMGPKKNAGCYLGGYLFENLDKYLASQTTRTPPPDHTRQHKFSQPQIRAVLWIFFQQQPGAIKTSDTHPGWKKSLGTKTNMEYIWWNEHQWWTLLFGLRENKMPYKLQLWKLWRRPLGCPWAFGQFVFGATHGLFGEFLGVLIYLLANIQAEILSMTLCSEMGLQNHQQGVCHTLWPCHLH